MPTETQLRKPVVESLRKVGALVTPYVGSLRGINGTADVHIVHTLWYGWVEFKGPETKREPLQEKFIWDCRVRKYPAVFLRLMGGNNGIMEWPYKLGKTETTKTRGNESMYMWLNVHFSWGGAIDLLEFLREEAGNG